MAELVQKRSQERLNEHVRGLAGQGTLKGLTVAGRGISQVKSIAPSAKEFQTTVLG